MMASPGLLLLAIGAAILASAGLTWGAIAYAHRRAMFDQPGHRRSHRNATARGGGVAIVVVVAAAAAMLGRLESPAILTGFVVGLVGVALIGWVDDHRPISARSRLAVHFAASVLFVSCLPSYASNPLLAAAIIGLKVLLLATAINFFNFMDGINGLVASQSVWIAACAAVLFALSGHPVPALLATVLAAACLGFLPFNFPRARIFLGDVGSGGLGFACGALLLWCDAVDAASVWILLPIASAIGVDAGLTLLSRMLRGRRWYTAHREHLYQWMVRSGRDHASTTTLYFLWNLILVLPVLLLARSYPAMAPIAVVGVFLVGGATWCLGKRRIPERVRKGARWP